MSNNKSSENEIPDLSVMVIVHYGKGSKQKRHLKLLPYEIRTLEKLQNSIRNGLRMKRDGFILHHHNGGEIQEGTLSSSRKVTPSEEKFDKIEHWIYKDDRLYDGISPEYHVDINTKTAGAISTIVTCEQDNIDLVVGSRKNFTILSIDKTYGDKASVKLNKKSTNLAWDHYPLKLKMVDKYLDIVGADSGKRMVVKKFYIPHEGDISIKLNGSIEIKNSGLHGSHDTNQIQKTVVEHFEIQEYREEECDRLTATEKTKKWLKSQGPSVAMRGTGLALKGSAAAIL